MPMSDTDKQRLIKFREENYQIKIEENKNVIYGDTFKISFASTGSTFQTIEMNLDEIHDLYERLETHIIRRYSE